jgi:hypothetical protein
MSTKDFKKAWEEAIRRAALGWGPGCELVDRDLAAAAGLPMRSGLRAGLVSTMNPMSAGCQLGTYTETVSRPTMNTCNC